MIFGYEIDFINEVELNFKIKESTAEKRIIVQEKEIPNFSYYTEYFPHSLQNVRYGSYQYFGKTKGYNVDWTMEIKDIVQLVWFAEKGMIGYKKGLGFTSERLRFWVYHTFLPLLFQMENKYNILHVGSVEVNGKAIIFMAPSFGGKSTLTDYFLRKGHKLLSDDTLAIETLTDGSFRAIASWPFHRPYREAEVLGIEIKHFVTQPLTIDAVYRLERMPADAEVNIKDITGIEKFKTLHYGAFISLNFLKDKTFSFHTSFAKAIAVKQITVPWEKTRLDEVYTAIVEHVKA